MPNDDPQGPRTFPPFQSNGGGPNGGPLFTLKGEKIDLFIHLTGGCPGRALETGDTFALGRAVGPTLPARVASLVVAGGVLPGRRIRLATPMSRKITLW